jgi:cell division protein FtsN
MVTVVELIDNDILAEEPLRLRSVAVDCAAAGEALSDPQIGPERRRELAARLRTADTAVGRLRQLADRLAVEVLRLPPTQPQQQRAPRLRHQLQVAIGPENQKEQAEQLARTLLAGGFAARVEPAPAGRLRVVVGPYPEKDAALLERLQKAYPYLKPLWIEAL